MTARYLHQANRTKVYRRSGYIDDWALTSECGTSATECDYTQCGNRSGDIACANCKHVRGTCWGYPEWEHIASVGPISEEEARKAIVDITVKDFDTAGSDELIGVAQNLTCHTVDANGTTCDGVASLENAQGEYSGLVTYAISLWSSSTGRRSPTIERKHPG